MIRHVALVERTTLTLLTTGLDDQVMMYSSSEERQVDCLLISSLSRYRLGGLVVKASASRAEDPEFESRFHRDFSGSSHTSDLEIGTPVATLPGA